MNKTIKSIASVIIITVLCTLSPVSMSGCSDFDFNPIGSWKITSDKIYDDGKFFSDEKPGYLHTVNEETKESEWVYIGDIIYTFGKSGTGIVSVDDQKERVQTQEFTYEYTDKQVTIHVSDNYSKRMNLEPVVITYSIEKDNNGNTILKTQDKFTSEDEEGNKHNMNEVRILTRE